MQARRTEPPDVTAVQPLQGPNIPVLALASLGAVAAVVLGVTFQDGRARLHILSGFLLVLAVAEGSFGALHLLRPQRFNSGPPNLYLRQHLGLYNLFAALLYGLAAVDPVRNSDAILAAICLYVLHAGYELCCSLGIAPLGTPAFRTRRGFAVDSLGLLVVIFPIAWFYRLALAG
jgi:hypothetical protein